MGPRGRRDSNSLLMSCCWKCPLCTPSWAWRGLYLNDSDDCMYGFYGDTKEWNGSEVDDVGVDLANGS